MAFVIATVAVGAPTAWLFTCGPMRRPLHEGHVIDRLKFTGKLEEAALLKLAVDDRAMAQAMLEYATSADTRLSLDAIRSNTRTEIEVRCQQAGAFLTDSPERRFYLETQLHLARMRVPSPDKRDEAAHQMKFNSEWRDMYDWFINHYPDRHVRRPPLIDEYWASRFCEREDKLLAQFNIHNWKRPIDIYKTPTMRQGIASLITGD